MIIGRVGFRDPARRVHRREHGPPRSPSGPELWRLINATFGNLAEMIIAGLAVRAGLLEVVKASLTGSILGKVQLLAPYTMIAVAIYFLP